MKKVVKIESDSDLSNLPDEVRNALLAELRGVPNGVYINIFVSAIAKALKENNVLKCSDVDFKKISAVAANLAMNYFKEDSDNSAPGFINKTDELIPSILMGMEFLLKFETDGFDCCRKISDFELSDAMYEKAQSVIKNMLVGDAERDCYENAIFELMVAISNDCISSTRKNLLLGNLKGMSHGMVGYLTDMSYEISQKVWLGENCKISRIGGKVTDEIITKINALSEAAAIKCVTEVCDNIGFTDSDVISQAITKVKLALAFSCIEKHNYPLYLKLSGMAGEIRLRYLNLVNDKLPGPEYVNIISEAATYVSSVSDISQISVKNSLEGLLSLKRDKASIEKLNKDIARGQNIKIDTDLISLFYPELGKCNVERESAVSGILKKVRSVMIMGEKNV